MLMNLFFFLAVFDIGFFEHFTGENNITVTKLNNYMKIYIIMLNISARI